MCYLWCERLELRIEHPPPTNAFQLSKARKQLTPLLAGTSHRIRAVIFLKLRLAFVFLPSFYRNRTIIEVFVADFLFLKRWPDRIRKVITITT